MFGTLEKHSNKKLKCFVFLSANQIQVIQRQPFFQPLPSIITFYRLKKIPKKIFFESNKNSANRPSRKGKNHFQVRQKKGIHNNEKTILDRNNFFYPRENILNY